MIRLFIKSTLRLIARDKLLTSVKIISLALGIVALLFTCLFCLHELSYDKNHADHDRIYRYVHRVKTPEGTQSFAYASATIGPALKERYPEVESYARVFFTTLNVKSETSDISFNERKFAFVENNFLQIFNFPLKNSADLKNILTKPFSVILTPNSAEKYFGKENPIGKILLANGELQFTVAGVFEKNFNTTHFNFDFVASFSSLEAIKKVPKIAQQIPASINLERKGYAEFYTYLKLSPQTDPKSLEAKFPQFTEEFRGPGKSERIKPFLQSLESIHLESDLLNEINQNGSIQTIVVYISVGVLIMLIACINYINISTAEFINRANGIGLKKILGINRNALIWTHLTETSILTALAVFISFCTALLVLPYFNSMVGRSIELSWRETTLILISVFLFTVLASGLYPALNITKVNGLTAFKGLITRKPSVFSLRNALVFAQLLISFCLVSISLLIYTQIDYLLSKNLGFDSDQVLVINGTGTDYQQRLNFKNALSDNKNVMHVAQCSTPPGESFATIVMTLKENSADEDSRTVIYRTYVDSDYLKALGLQLETGRFFDGATKADSTNYLVVNNAAALVIGDNVMTRDIDIPNPSMQKTKKNVIGIIKDFHFASFHTSIEPLMLEYSPDLSNYILIRFNGKTAEDIITQAKKVWENTIHSSTFDYYFLDDGFSRHYENEQRMKKVITCIAILAIGLAVLGIFGTTLFYVKQRTKEVGIRKVMGCLSYDLLILLFKPTFYLLTLSSVISIPLVILIGKDWLNRYPYHTDFSPAIFIITFLIILSVVFLTTFYHLYKTIKINPTEVLRQKA